MKNFADNLIVEDQSIREALIQLNELGDLAIRALFVLNKDGQMVGTLTDGDIRRGLINGAEVSEPISKIMHTNFRSLKKGQYTIDDLLRLRADNIGLVPFLDEHNFILKIIDFSKQASLLPIDGMIMAGGKGERLRPLTESMPKPMLLVGDKPILEHNISRMVNFGIENIQISLGYLPEKISGYFGDGKKMGCNIGYIVEEKPLGTIGSIKLVKNFSSEVILLMNADILSNINFEEFYIDFVKQKAAISIACIPYHVNVPYAVLETEGGRVTSLCEKPTYTYYSNAGIYLIRKEYLNLIPDNEMFNATDLIEILLKQEKKVVTFPILGYWMDIGRHEDYKKAQEDIKHLHL